MSTVGILGAGLSGVAMAIELRRRGIDDFVVYDRFPDVGGTWYRNTYPGLHCDIPSHMYCYSFEPNPDFSMVYASQAEIQEYIRSCAHKHGVLDHIRFETTVESARYSDEGMWNLELADGSLETHRVLVGATGGLTEPHYPRVDGRERFEGLQWHSGSWRHDVDLAGRRVAVIGSAASAVQVVPEVARVASELFVYSRTPNWVLPRDNRTYSDDERAAMRSPTEWNRVRRELYRLGLVWQEAFEKKPRAVEDLRARVMAAMRSAIGDEDVIAALTPDYEPGCKRILVSDNYYPALALDHVTLVPHAVSELTETGVVASDGSERTVDVVIYCTGYRLGGREDGRPRRVGAVQQGERSRKAIVSKGRRHRTTGKRHRRKRRRENLRARLVRSSVHPSGSRLRQSSALSSCDASSCSMLSYSVLRTKGSMLKNPFVPKPRSLVPFDSTRWRRISRPRVLTTMAVHAM